MSSEFTPPNPKSQEDLSHEQNDLAYTESGYPKWWASSPALSFFVKYQRILSILGVVLMMLILAGGLMISQISAKHGLLVFSSHPQYWSAGSQVALRVEARALALGSRSAILNAQVRFESPYLPDFPPQALSQALGVSRQDTIQLPETPGTWTMIIEAEAISAQGIKGEVLKGGLAQTPPQRAKRLGDKVQLRASLPLNLLSKATSSTFAPYKPARTPDLLKARSANDATIKSFAADQRLSFELPSELLIITIDEHGKPLFGTLSLTVNDASNTITRLTEKEGITSLTLTPRSPTIDLKMNFRENEGDHETLLSAESYERIWPQAHQFALTPSSQVIHSNGGLFLTLKSTQPAQGLFVDLWWGKRWLSTHIAYLDQAGEGQLQIPCPPFQNWDPDLRDHPKILWVQAYQSPYQPGETRGGRYLVYQPPHMDLSTLGTWLLTELKDLKVTQKEWPQLASERWLSTRPLRLLLGRIQRPKVDPELIINDVASSKATATLLKRQYQSTFFLFMAALCLIILCALAGLMFIHQKKLAPLRAELNLAGGQSLLWFLQVALILMCFFGGMMYLVHIIRW